MEHGRSISSKNHEQPTKKPAPERVVDDENQPGEELPEGFSHEYYKKNLQKILAERVERQQFLEEAGKMSRAAKGFLYSRAAEALPYDRHYFCDSGLMGEAIPLRVLFLPDRFLCTFDFNTACTSTHMEGFISWAKRHPHLLIPTQIRLLCRYLSVTTSKLVCDTLTPYVKMVISSGKYIPSWKDIDEILMNLGLGQHAYEFLPTTYYFHIPTPRGKPRSWNFRVVIMIIGCAFSVWDTRELLALVKFLSECVFEVSFTLCRSDVIILLRRIVKHLLQSGHSPHELMLLIDQSHVSAICNIHLILLLSSDPCIIEVTSHLSYRTAYQMLKCEHENVSLSTIAQVLDRFTEPCLEGPEQISGNVFTNHVVLICENLIRTSPNSSEAKRLLASLCSFVQRMDDMCDDGLGILFTFERLEFLTSSCDLGNVTGTLTDSLAVVPNEDSELSAMAQFLANHFDVACNFCSHQPAAFPAATVLSQETSEFFETSCSLAVFSLTHLLPLNTYISQHVFLSPQLLKYFLCMYSVASSSDEHMLKTLLELHLVHHPPCRGGMVNYYLTVLKQPMHTTSSISEKLVPETFFDIIQRYSVAMGSYTIPHADSSGSSLLYGKVDSKANFECEKLMFLFKYVVDILLHDYYWSAKHSSVPLVVKIVWGSEDSVSLNSHCKDVIDMYLKAPSPCRYDIGVYLVLLAGTLQKSPSTLEDIFWSIGSNDLVDVFVNMNS